MTFDADGNDVVAPVATRPPSRYRLSRDVVAVAVMRTQRFRGMGRGDTAEPSLYRLNRMLASELTFR